MPTRVVIESSLLSPIRPTPYRALAMTDREIEAALRQIRPEKAHAFPLGALQGMRVLRGYLEELEPRCIERSLELGASVEDVADALGITRQGVYYKLRRLAEEGGSALPALEDDVVEA
jgi:transcriptional regulator with PAS, ATPase and Fis domain